MVNEKSITITMFIEAHCPYCRYVEHSILHDLQARRIELNTKLRRQGHMSMPIIEINLVDVEANKGCREMQWFDQYSEKMGGMYTPAIKIEGSQKIFYMWGKDKKEVMGEKEIGGTQKLRADILMEIQDVLSKVDKAGLMYDKDLYNHKRHMVRTMPHAWNTPFGGFRGFKD
jgi:hypothetical protein